MYLDDKMTDTILTLIKLRDYEQEVFINYGGCSHADSLL